MGTFFHDISMPNSPYILIPGVEQYFFESIFHDFTKTLWTIEQDGIRGKLLTSSKH